MLVIMNKMTQQEKLILGLMASGEPEWGSATVRKLLLWLKNAQLELRDFWLQLDKYQNLPILSEKKWAKLKQIQQQWTVEKFAEYLDRCRCQITVIEDRDYPALLKFIPDAAPVLFYQGDPTVLHRPTLAVVGSRKVTDYGRAVIRTLLSERLQKMTIISGMMSGVDALAQAQALAVGAKTVACLGYGLEMTWPATVKLLREQIVAQGGLLLSEYAPWSEPVPYKFVQRNRLVAGASLATLVIEAAAKSGSLITASLALDYGREVMSVPGSIFGLQSAGCLELIAKGATPVMNDEDIIRGLVESRVSYLPDSFYDALGENQKMVSQESKLAAKQLMSIKEKILLPELSDPQQNQIYQAVQQTKLTTEDLAEKLQLTINQLTMNLSLLELAGKIERDKTGFWGVKN